MPAYHWSADELAQLRQLAAGGLPTLDIAERLGRTHGAILSAMHRHGLSLSRQEDAVRRRILELITAGWSVSRISKQHGLNPVAIRRVLAQEGVSEPTIGTRPIGRFVAEGEAA